MGNKNKFVCKSCEVTEGELHKFGCKKEKCPFCGDKLIKCGCQYKKLGLYDKNSFAKITNYLPMDVYENGLSEKFMQKWKDILNNKGRVSYIYYPSICCKCGKVNPKKASAIGDTWRFFIELSMRDKVICEKCYDFIFTVITHKTLGKLTPGEQIYSEYCRLTIGVGHENPWGKYHQIK